jgi:hypothetical protein
MQQSHLSEPKRREEFYTRIRISRKETLVLISVASFERRHLMYMKMFIFFGFPKQGRKTKNVCVMCTCDFQPTFRTNVLLRNVSITAALTASYRICLNEIFSYDFDRRVRIWEQVSLF